MSETLEAVANKDAAETKKLAEQLLAQAKEQGTDLVGPGGLLNELTKTALETALEAEMTEHVGYEKHDPARRRTGNSRNGTRSKTVVCAPVSAAFTIDGIRALLLRLIDPSVLIEDDPLSVDPTLNPFDVANGFAEPPHSSTYRPEFVQEYRAAQRERVSRLDTVARERVAAASTARRRFKESGDPADRRASLAPRVMTVYRTDADLRFVDLSLSPNERPYGSLFGRRPDLTNYGLIGFARFTTPDAWLSTWSGLSTNADFVRCARGVTVPSLFVELTGDQACFPEDARKMVAALGSPDKTHTAVAGTHFGGPIRAGAPTGASLAAAEIEGWLAERFT